MMRKENRMGWHMWNVLTIFKILAFCLALNNNILQINQNYIWFTWNTIENFIMFNEMVDKYEKQ